MKVLHVLNTSTFSGAENVACQIIKMYEKTDISMAYCSRDGSVRKQLEDLRIDYYPIAEMSCRELDRVIAEYKPDIIHAHDMRATYYSCKNHSRVPVICHIHNNAYDSRRISKKSVAFLIASLRIRHIFWVSDEALSDYAFYRMVRKKSTVLLNIIDWDSINEKISKDNNTYSFDIVFLGRLSDEKAPLRFIEIVDDVRKSYPELKVAVIGDGQLRDDVQRMVSSKNLLDVVTLFGYMNNPLKVLKDSKCLVLTSKREGLPMCAIESQMVGTPIICTPVGALPKIVESDRTGYLCNSNSEFVSSILSVICDKDNCQRLSDNSIEFAKRYNDKQVFMDKLSGQYRMIAKSNEKGDR